MNHVTSENGRKLIKLGAGMSGAVLLSVAIFGWWGEGRGSSTSMLAGSLSLVGVGYWIRRKSEGAPRDER